MNKHCYRHIFNKARGIIMAVAETVNSRCKSPGNSRSPRGGSKVCATAILSPLSMGIGLLLGSVFLPTTSWADIVADVSAPGNQQATVLLAPNGVPLVNIQTPSAAGVSRNTYSQFDVDRQGAILNNSRTNTSTQLGGWVQGNPWLATGSATVILNEVNSSNPSYLNGYIEVAGQRAEVIIANPAGISCSDCGFINSHRATLTTGTPIINGGNLEGYRVEGGVITIAGNQGFDASTTDFTDLIAQSVQVNAGIWANDLSVTTGNNEVAADHSQISKIASSGGTTPAYAIDVAQLGGMYAGKITLVGTQDGVGVRHAGNIGASTGDVLVTVDGRIESSGNIWSDTANIQLVAQGDIDHSGTIDSEGNIQLTTQGTLTHSGEMDSSSSITLTTQGDLHNQGGILAKADITATANGVNSQLTSSHTSTLAAGVQEDNTIGDAGNITLTASGAIVAQGNHFSGDQQTITGKSVSLSGSDTAANALNVTATEGGIDMSGATVTAESTLALTTTQTLTTDSAEVGAETLAITARSLSNVQGELQQTGQADLAISLAGDLDNTEGTIATNSAHLNVEAAILVNTRGVLSHAGTGKLDIDAATLTGEQGQIVTNGDLDITAATLTLNRATTTSQGRIAIDSETFNHQQGTMIQAGDADGSIVATTILDNTDGLIATNGNLTTTAGDVINQGGTIQVTGQVTDEVTGEVSGTTKSLTINASGVIDNQAKEGTKGDIYADNNVSITAASLDNSQSRIAAANALAITTTSNVDNTSGTLAANQTVTVNASEIDNTQGNIGSVNADAQLTATTGQIDNTQGRIEAATEITITSQGLDNDEGVILAAKQAINTGLQALSNERGQIIANGIESTDTLTITSGALNNDQGLIQAKAAINIDTQGNILTNTNSGNDKGIIGQQSSITLTTGDLNNQSGYIGSAGDLEATSENIDNSQNGILLSETQMQLTGTALDNNTGKVQATDALTINLGTGQLTNTSGLIRSGGHADVTAGTVLNNTTQGIDQGLEANSLSVTASESIDNTEGVIRANAQLTLAAGTSINNTRGLVSSANHDVILQDTDLANNNLTITNTDGTLVAGQTLDIDSHSLSGDGNLYSEGDIDIALTSTYTHTGDLVANGNAKLHTTGNIDNHSTMSAGQLLDLQAATLDTQAGSELIANSLKLSATDSNTFNNRGLIDGVNTEIDTITLNNLGTGRIYGDHVSISATTVNNEEENGVAAVIAARIRLDIGAQTINNRDHSLIFSAGDMAIGGALDGDRHATGQATTLNNYSATIESLGNMNLSALTVNNINQSFTTATQTLNPESINEYKLNSGDGVKPIDKTTRYSASQISIYTCKDSATCAKVNATGDASDAYTRYSFTRTISQTVATNIDPGQILSGGSLALNAGTVNNDKSQIIAGANISLSGGTVNNTSATGDKTTTDSGTATSYWRERDKDLFGSDDYFTKSSQSAYKPAAVKQTISIAPAVYEANTAVSGTGTQVAAYTNDSDTPTIDSVSGNDSARTGGGLDRIIRFTSNDTTGSGGASEVLTGGLNLTVTNSGLFTSDSDAPNGYVVETDPAFASYRSWLSSDYLLSAMSTDPSTVQQRLGDGFYEQRLIREQVAMLTGRRFLENYSDDEQQYQQLMEDGALFAQAHELRPGVGLSAEQMAQLTSDIVWLVEKTIMLADGQTIQALVPQVYVRVQDGDLSASGGLIAADNSLELNISNDLNNFGTIAGRQIADISADNINNLGGRLRGDDVTLTAARDINIIGGRVDAGSRLAAFAGNDIFVESTTRSQAVASSQVGSEPTNGIGFKKTFNKPQYTVSSTNTRTNIDRVAGLYVSDSNGLLTASAGRDLILKAAGVDSAGSAQLLAGNDVRLETVTTAADTRVTWDSNNYNREYSQTEVGSSIQSRDDLLIQAQRDLLARAAEVGSLEGALEATAGGNIEITAGEHTDGLDAASKHTSKGFLSKRTLITRDDIQQTALQSSSFSGRTVNLQAGQDVVLTGSDVLADAGVSITAGNDITIESGQQRYVDNSERIDKKSGLMSGGSFGFTIGSRQQTDQIDQTRISQRASTVGSLSGDVTLTADNDVTITSSDLLARDGDIAISGDNVSFIADDDTFAQDEVHKFKQSGLTIALSGGAVDTLNTIQRSTERIQETDNSRLGALHAWQAGQAAQALPGQIDSLSSLGDDFSNPLDAAGEGAESSGVNLSISLGSSKSEQRRQIRQSNAQGSTVFASGDLTVTARGDDDRAGSGDISAQGALLQGNNVILDAADEITLQSAENHQSDDSQSKSSSVGIGISIGSGGLNFYVEASKSKGFTNKSDDQYLESQIIGSNNVTLRSGSDTTLEGAQVRGESITADIGGDLNIVSQQDRSTFEQENKTMGFKAQYGTDSGVSASMSELEARANYLAVQEQTGLFAGDDGFDIDVANNTALTGGVIVSTADAENNRISTESLTAKQINNTTEYSVESMSISVGNIGGNSLSGGAASDSDSQSNTTYSALSEGTIGIRNGDTSALATIKGSEAEAHTILENNFNQDLITDVQDQLEAQLMAGELVGAAVQDYAESQLEERDELLLQAAEASTDEERQLLTSQAESINDDWGKDSSARRVITAALVGAAGGNFADTLQRSVTMEGLSVVQDSIGDIAVEHNVEEGDIRKVFAHAVAGGIASQLAGGEFSSGALAGGLSEILSGTIGDSDLKDEEQVALQQMIATLAVASTSDSDSGSAALAGQIAGSAHENNYLGHTDIARWEESTRLVSEACLSGGGGGDCQQTLEDRQALQAELKNTSFNNTVAMYQTCQSGDVAGCQEHLDSAKGFTDWRNDIYNGSYGGLPITSATGDFDVTALQVDVTKTQSISTDNLDWGENLDELALDVYQDYVDGKIGSTEANAKIYNSIINHDSKMNMTVGGATVVLGAVAIGGGCIATVGVGCVVAAVGGGAAVVGGIDETVDGVVTYSLGRAIENPYEQFGQSLGLSKEQAQEVRAYIDAGAMVVEIAAGGYGIIKSGKMIGKLGNSADDTVVFTRADDTGGSVAQQNPGNSPGIADNVPDINANLDDLYGAAEPPNLVKNFETINYNPLTGELGGSVVKNPDLKVWQPGDTITLDVSKRHIFSVNKDGNVITGSELNIGSGTSVYDNAKLVDYNLGHPTLTGGEASRFSGELIHKDGKWFVNGESGRYTSPYTDRTQIQLENTAELIRSLNFPVEVVPLPPKKLKYIIK